MMRNPPDEEHIDILQNLEWSILTIYMAQPELTDYQVDSALEALGRTYVREIKAGQPVLPKSEPAKAVYEALRQACEWRLGREQVVDDEGQPMSVEPVSMEVILSCLKRMRKSLSLWNKEGGTRGYLTYIQQFFQ